MSTNNKIQRILAIFLIGIMGKEFSVSELAAKFKVSEKTIKRDINEIRVFFADYREQFGNMDVVYSRKRRKYYINDVKKTFNIEET